MKRLAWLLLIAALALVTLLAATLGRRGIASLRPLLAVQLLLLSGCLLICVAGGVRVDLGGEGAVIAGMLAVAAMAVQNAIVQVSVAGMP